MGTEILPLDNRHSDYLRDESRQVGWAQSISFPENEAEVCHIITRLANLKIPVTVQGSRTGICGGAVPAGGHILNLSRMKNIVGMAVMPDGHFSLRVQPGLTLAELNRWLHHPVADPVYWNEDSRNALTALSRADQQFWPPDPTEDSASIGGIGANNSRGITAHYYGPAQKYIKAIRVVDFQGYSWSIDRGFHFSAQGKCLHPNGTLLTVETTLLNDGPAVDLLDLYLGSEGMFGAITELTLDLLPMPKECWGIVFFFADESQAAGFVDSIRHKEKGIHDAQIVAVEFFDKETLLSIHQLKKVNSRLAVLPEVPAGMVAAVYLELHGNVVEEIEELAAGLLDTSVSCGCDPDSVWAFSGEQEMLRARLFRHAAPESVNFRIDQSRLLEPSHWKLGTDMQMVTCTFTELLNMYRSDLKRAGLKAAIFGHAGDLHLHVNFLPDNHDEFLAAQQIIAEWAKKTDAGGGQVATEHGVGKVKKFLFQSIPFPRQLAIIRDLKQQLDPGGFFNRGNIFDSKL